MKAVLQFYRVGNMVISGIATLLGFWIGGISPLHTTPWLPVAAMLLLTAFANSHNDLVDYAVDRINRPGRPLPSGRLSLRSGYLLAWGSLLLALLIGLLDSSRHFVLFALLGITLWVYNKYLKGRPLVGNLWVALLTASPLLVAALDTGWQSQLWPPMLFAFLLSFAREMIKDIEDIPGDAACGLRTFPIACGIAPARQAVIVLLVVTGISLPFPVLLATYPASFLGFCAVLVLPPVGLALRATVAGSWRKAQGLVKIAMLGGILAALGALHWG